MARRRVTVALTTIWGLGVAIGVFVLAYEARLPYGDGDEVARLSVKSGTVQVRSRAVPLWLDAFEGQGLVDQDVIATGDDSTARLLLKSGREIILRPGTQVVLASPKAGDATELVVTLKQGEVATGRIKRATANANVRPIVLRARDKVVTLTRPDAVVQMASSPASAPIIKATVGDAEIVDLGRLAHVEPVTAGPVPKAPVADTLPVVPQSAVATPLAQIVAATPAPAVPTLAPTTLAVVSTPPPAPKTIPTAPAVVATKPPLSLALAARPARPAPPLLSSPRSGARLWSRRPLSASPLGIALTQRGGTLPPSTLFVAALGSNVATIAAPAAYAGKARQVVSIEGSVLLRAVVPETSGGVPISRLTLRPGVKDGAGQSLAPAMETIFLGSFAALAGRTVTALVGGEGGADAAMPPEAPAWLVERDGLDESSARYSVQLANGAALGALAPVLAKGFRLRDTTLPDDGVAHVVSGGKIVATISAAPITTAAVSEVAAALGADFVFLGPRGALVPGYVKGAPFAFETLTAKRVFARRGTKLVEIETRLLRGNSSAAQLVRQTAQSLFLAPVEVLYER